MDIREREYEIVELDGKQVRMQVIRKGDSRSALTLRILKVLREHPDGLNKTHVYLYAGCYPANGHFVLAQLEAKGEISFEQQSSFGKPIICRLAPR
jgi:hypothetical protein